VIASPEPDAVDAVVDPAQPGAATQLHLASGVFAVMRFNTGQVTLLLATSLAVGCGANENASSHWAGKTYLLDIGPKHWTKPTRDVGGEIAPFVPQFLFAITGEGTDLTVTLATATGGIQNMCNLTQEAALSESQYPKSQIVVPEFPMAFQELDDRVTPNQMITVHSTLHNLVFADVLPGDSTTSAGTFDVAANIAELCPLFIRIDPLEPTVDNVCQLLADAGAACETCAFDSSSKTCLTLGSRQLAATPATATVTRVSSGEIAADCP
jgi:hypothetical protein